LYIRMKVRGANFFQPLMVKVDLVIAKLNVAVRMLVST
jgi:hypothetical protein